MIINRSLLALYALPILVAGAEAGAADDAKMYPGTMCQTTISSDPVIRDDLSGRMINNAGFPQIWICPIVRDTMAENTAEFAALSAGVAARVECTFETRSGSGTDPHSFDPDDPNPPTVDFLKRFTYGRDEFDNPKLTGAEFGVYYFKCLVRPGGYIMSYQIEEDE